MVAAEWFRAWFSSPYYDLLYNQRNEQEATFCINKFVEFLNIPAASRILDVACGKGRHSRALASRGFDVTGIDLSAPSIIEAKNFETDNLHFYVHDMRLPFWINYFDYVFNFFTSFGYFRTMREHDDAIRTMAQSLKMNGTVTIDYLNVHYAEDHLVPREEKRSNGVMFNIDRWFDEKHFFKRIHVEETEKKISETFTEQVEKFSLGDFTDMLSYEGLAIEHIFGDYELNKYHVRNSPRMIMVARKIH
ncbi:MAG TPA: methyltransferase domain-containing protein [Parafilimonas sp.]|nr:methyltransferase domain-containing protein [Parafilimonas sp.]